VQHPLGILIQASSYGPPRRLEDLEASRAEQCCAVVRRGKVEREGYEGRVRDISSDIVKVLHSQMERE
jgi:hypothetical protein